MFYLLTEMTLFI